MSELRRPKVVILGAPGVGKDKFIKCFEKGEYDEQSTKNPGFFYTRLKIPNNHGEIDMWKTVGADQMRFMVSTYCKDAYCGVFLVDITDHKSFEVIEDFKKIYCDAGGKENLILVSNKMDIVEQNISIDELSQYADKNQMKLFQISVKTGKNFNVLKNYIFSVAENFYHATKRASFPNVPIPSNFQRTTSQPRLPANNKRRQSLKIDKKAGEQFSEVIELSNENKNLRDKIEMLESENEMYNRLKIEFHTLKEKANELHEEINTLKAENQNLKKEIKELKIQNENLKENSSLSSNNLSESENTKPNFHLNRKKYIKMKKLGHGSIGDVMLVQETDSGQEFAQKIYSTDCIDKDTKKEFIKKLEAGRVLNNPCVGKISGYFERKKKKQLSLIQELGDNGTLQDILDSPPCEWNSTRKTICIIEIVVGMVYLHSMGFVHKGLKPNNIICMDRLHFKISDVFDSKYNELRSNLSSNSSMSYNAPEIINNEKYDGKADVFSFAILLFYVVTNELPKTKMVDLLNGKRVQIPDSVLPFTSSLISKCWSQNPDDRPSFSDILSCLEENEFKIINDVDTYFVFDRFGQINERK